MRQPRTVVVTIQACRSGRDHSLRQIEVPRIGCRTLALASHRASHFRSSTNPKNRHHCSCMHWSSWSHSSDTIEGFGNMDRRMPALLDEVLEEWEVQVTSCQSSVYCFSLQCQPRTSLELKSTSRNPVPCPQQNASLRRYNRQSIKIGRAHV